MLRRKNNLNNKRAQSLVEYTIVLGIVVGIITAMQAMVQRGAQGMIKIVADQVGAQRNAEQLSFRDSNSSAVLDEERRGGALDHSYTTVRSSTNKERQDFLGTTSYLFSDVVETTTTAQVNLGFTEQIVE